MTAGMAEVAIFALVVGVIVLLVRFFHAVLTGVIDGSWRRRLSVPRGRIWQAVYEMTYQRMLSAEDKGEARARKHEDRLRKKGKPV